jgi:hypothetical protein
MTRKQLVALLNRLFGSQTEAARQLKTPRRTIAAWGKENPIHPAVAALLLMLDAERNRKE